MSRSNSNRGAAAILLLVLALQVALAFGWPEEGVAGFRLWSLTALRALPLPVAGVLVLFAILAGHRTYRRTHTGEDALSGTVPGWRSKLARAARPRVFRFVALLTALGLITTFSVRYGLLGDNWLRVTEALHGSGNGNERGAIAFYSALVRAFGDGSVEGAAELFRTVGLVSGLAYSLIWLGLTSRRETGSGERNALVTLALFSGVFLLFCGYLEIYAPLLVLVLLTTLVTLRAVRTPALMFVPPLLALGAAAFHLVALLWLPMSLVPALSRVIGRSRGRVLAVTALAIATGVTLALLLSRESSLFLRLTPAPGRPYALLSLAHLSDYLNAQWVGSLAGVLLGWGGVFVAFRRPEFTTATWVALWGWLLPGIGLFLFNPVLGAADWDVLSLAAPFGLLVAMTAWETAGGRTEQAVSPERGRGPSFLSHPVFPVAVALNILVTPAWFLLHRSEASVDWVSELVRTDRADYYQSHPPSLHLAFLYGSNGLMDARAQALDVGRRSHPDDPRFPLGLARIAAAEGSWSEAEALAMEAYGIVRGYLPALDVLYEVFRATGRRTDQRGVGELLLETAAADPAGTSQFLPQARLEEIRRDLEALDGSSSARD